MPLEKTWTSGRHSSTRHILAAWSWCLRYQCWWCSNWGTHTLHCDENEIRRRVLRRVRPSRDITLTATLPYPTLPELKYLTRNIVICHSKQVSFSLSYLKVFQHSASVRHPTHHFRSQSLRDPHRFLVHVWCYSAATTFLQLPWNLPVPCFRSVCSRPWLLLFSTIRSPLIVMIYQYLAIILSITVKTPKTISSP